MLPLGAFIELCLVRGGVSESPRVQGPSPRFLHSPCVLGKWRHLPFLTGLCITSFLTSSFPSVEGLKDLLVGPGVELLLMPREPALPMEAESGGNTSPGITASECQGRKPRWWVGGIKENGWFQGPSVSGS